MDNDKKSDMSKVPSEEDEDDTRWYEFIPLALCLAILLSICIFLIVDWNGTL
jgi:hypothetical protein